jgi:hypothetical protein
MFPHCVGMERKSSVQIVVNADGVVVVRLCGQAWSDEADASRLYAEIRHLVGEIDRTLKISRLIE